MKATLVITWVLFSMVAAREIVFESFNPLPETDKDVFEFGTLRVKKLDRNSFSLAGSFVTKRNIGNEAIVGVTLFKVSNYNYFTSNSFRRKS